MNAAGRVKNALAGFLGTYASRNTDYKGYWLFGFLVSSLSELSIDLLTPSTSGGSTADDAVKHLARAKFRDQISKNGISEDQVRDARLALRRLPGESTRNVNGWARTGFMVSFQTDAVMQNSRHYGRSCVVFVAPHDPEVERCSARRQ